MYQIRTTTTSPTYFRVIVNMWCKLVFAALSVSAITTHATADTIPAKKFDLREWKITLPTDTDGNGKVDY